MKLKKILSIFLIAVLLVSSTLIALPVSAEGDGDTTPAWEYKTGTLSGEGTSASPYLINNAQDLATLAYLVNTGNNFSYNKYFKQTADIDLDNIPWQVIGRSDGTQRFCGYYDGQGYAIENLKIENIDGLVSYGLFGYTAWAAGGTKIENVNIVSGEISVSEAKCVGALVGYLYNGGKISGCSNMASVTVTNPNSHNSSNYMDTAIGGLIGHAGGSSFGVTIENCYNGGAVEVVSTTSTVNVNVAGIAGEARSSDKAITVSNSLNYGTIVVSNDVSRSVRAGGIVGYLNSMAHNAWSFNTGSASFTNVSSISDIVIQKTMAWNSPSGGLIGWARLSADNSATNGTLTVSGCFAKGELRGEGACDTSFAGMIGQLKETNLVAGEAVNYFANVRNRYDSEGALRAYSGNGAKLIVGQAETNAVINGAAVTTAGVVSTADGFTQGTTDIDAATLSLMSVHGVQDKKDATLGLCLRFVGELNLVNFEGIKDVGVCVIWGEKTANVSANKTLYSSLKQMSPDNADITPNGIGYLIAAGVSGVPETGVITLSFKPYVEFEDGTIAYGEQCGTFTYENGAYVAPQA